MQFEFTVTGLGGHNISCWDSAAIRNLNHEDTSNLQKVLDTFGKRSSKAQGLSVPVTDIFRLKSTDQRLYLMAARQAGVTTVLGGLKVGLKKLYVSKVEGGLVPVEPLCVLDFYVHESYQRQGVGKQLFEHFLAAEHLTPGALAYDRPSQKLLSFLARHYGLRGFVPQSNNFVLFDSFWDMHVPVVNDAKAGRRAGMNRAHHPHPVLPAHHQHGPPAYGSHQQPTYLTATATTMNQDSDQLRTSGAGLLPPSYYPEQPGLHQATYQQQPDAYEAEAAAAHHQYSSSMERMPGMMQHSARGDSLDAFLHQSQSQSSTVNGFSAVRPPYMDVASQAEPSSIHTPSGPAYLYRAMPAPMATVNLGAPLASPGAASGRGLDLAGGHQMYSGAAPYNTNPGVGMPYGTSSYTTQPQGMYQHPAEAAPQGSGGGGSGGVGGWTTQGRTRRTWQIPESESGVAPAALPPAPRWSRPPWGTDQDNAVQPGRQERHVGHTLAGNGLQTHGLASPGRHDVELRGTGGVDSLRDSVQGFGVGAAMMQATGMNGGTGQKGTVQTARAAALRARAGSGAAGCLAW